MEARKGNIYEILNGDKQFIIPVYQRYYSWGHDHCQQLWNDIIEMEPKGKQGYFVEYIVNVTEQDMPTGVQKFMIVDWQQRMTMLTLLLIALRNYALDHSDSQLNAKCIDKADIKKGEQYLIERLAGHFSSMHKNSKKAGKPNEIYL